MWFAQTRVLQDAIAALKAENSDLRAQVRLIQQAAHDRETALIDRLLAVCQPAAHREVHPLPPRPIVSSPGNGEHQRKVNFPGGGMLPPPVPRPYISGSQMQGSSVETERRVHTPEVGGSSPSPAPTPHEEGQPGEYIKDKEEDEHPTHPPPIEDPADG